MHPAFSRTDHRPLPLPQGRWIGRQSWHNLLFIHWPVPASALSGLVPPSVRIQEFDGTSWVGLIPFYMTDVMVRFAPAMPWLSAFPEMNLRLYVEHRGTSGIWFISLDASRWLAVQAARHLVHLPYFHSTMRVGRERERIRYASDRIDSPRPVSFAAAYWPTGAGFEARRGSLEYFLTERYALFTVDNRDRICTIEIHHQPWALQPAAAEIALNTVAAAQGVPVDSGSRLLHFSRRQDVVVWPLRRLGPAEPGREGGVR
jgi:uncharacterized protein YqjF (DUF2071 family)